MNNLTKCVILFIILVDLVILIFVENKCDQVLYLQAIKPIIMQALSLVLSTESKFSVIIIRALNLKLDILKVGAFFTILASFYLLFLAKKGIVFQNVITSCI